MGTGFIGTFVISWSQTEIDGLGAAPVQNLATGVAWTWRGDAVRVDGPTDVLRLDRAEGADALRKRAARMVRRLVGTALDGSQAGAPVGRTQVDGPLMDNSFVVTDGAKSYTVTLIDVGGASQPLLMFLDEIPPRNRDLWVVHHTLDVTPDRDMSADAGGVICFTPGTRVRTAHGVSLIEDLRPGDLVQTKDNGVQPIRWAGSRRMTGARLFAMPTLRPVRIQAGALDEDMPDQDLVVSPEHRMLIKGAAAQALFNAPEVLVAAKDMINGTSITVDMRMREVTYVHLLLDRHEVLWANGMETESFHPASASLAALDDADRLQLLRAYPELAYDPYSYGGYARRNLTGPEAAILRHAA